MADWTTGELRVLRSFHRSGKARSELHAAIPRHSPSAINAVATKQRVLLRAERRASIPEREASETPQQRRVRMANEYFARRAQGHLA